MSISDPDKVDVISIDPKTDEVVLTVVDHLAWDEEGEHLLALQHKINRYLDFIESGEIDERYPKAVGRNRLISVRFEHPPPEGLARQFLSRVGEIATEAGCGFSWKCLGQDDPS